MSKCNVLKNGMVTLVLVLMLAPAQGAWALPADPDNAALLYYQAFLSFEKAEGELGDMVSDVAEGKAKPDKDVEDYVDGCDGAIRLAVRASKLAKCDWGMVYSDGFDMVMPHLAQVRRLNRVLIASARVEIGRGNYDRATELCLASRRMAQQVEDPVLISHLVSCALDRDTYACIRELAYDLCDQPEKLGLLRRRLMELAPKDTTSSLPALKTEMEVIGQYMSLERIDDLFRALNGGKSKERPAVTEDQINKSYAYYKKHMAAGMSLLGGGRPYVETYSELAELDGKPKKDVEKDTAAVLANAVAPSMASLYNTDTAARAAANATMAGLEVCLVKARSGKLPDRLPSGLAKDPFTGKDFEYEKTKTGFILRCGAKDMKKDIVHEFEFGGSE